MLTPSYRTSSVCRILPLTLLCFFAVVSDAQLTAEEKNRPAVIIANLQNTVHTQKLKIASLEHTIQKLNDELAEQKKESLSHRMEANRLSQRVEQLSDTAEQLGAQLALEESSRLSCVSSIDGDRKKYDRVAADLERCRAREAHAVAAEANATQTASKLAQEVSELREARDGLAHELQEQRDAAAEVTALRHSLREKKRHLLALEAVWGQRLQHHVAEHHSEDGDALAEEQQSDEPFHRLYAGVDLDGVTAVQPEDSRTFLQVLQADEARYREAAHRDRENQRKKEQETAETKHQEHAVVQPTATSTSATAGSKSGSSSEESVPLSAEDTAEIQATHRRDVTPPIEVASRTLNKEPLSGVDSSLSNTDEPITPTKATATTDAVEETQLSDLPIKSATLRTTAEVKYDHQEGHQEAKAVLASRDPPSLVPESKHVRKEARKKEVTPKGKSG